ncbi:MAG: VWA domain-containing protein, partial [bacterium]|nr:VWA domain-containing protein [bacterium]
PVLEPGQRSGHDIGLAVDIDAGVPIRGVHSTSHAIDVWDDTGAQARVRIHPSDTIPNKDFVLRYEVAGEAPEVAVIPHHDQRGGFFTLIVQPQREMAEELAVPRELIFILDTSGSMRGWPLQKSKQAMTRLIAGMRAGDTFNVVRFAGGSGTLWPRPMAYTDDNARA